MPAHKRERPKTVDDILEEMMLPRPISPIEWPASPSDQDREKHTEAMLDEGTSVWTCAFCSQSYSKKNSYYSHLRRMHTGTPQSEMTTDEYQHMTEKERNNARIPLVHGKSARGSRKSRHETKPLDIDSAATADTSPSRPTARPVPSSDIKTPPSKTSKKRKKKEEQSLKLPKAGPSSGHPCVTWPWDKRRASCDDRQRLELREQVHENQATDKIGKAMSRKTSRSKTKKPPPVAATEDDSFEPLREMLNKRKSGDVAVDQTSNGHSSGDDFEPNYSDEFKLFFRTAMSMFNEMSQSSTSRLRSSSSTNHSASLLRANKFMSSSSTNQSTSSSMSNKLIMSLSSSCPHSTSSLSPPDKAEASDITLSALLARESPMTQQQSQLETVPCVVGTEHGCDGRVDVPRGQIDATRKCRAVSFEASREAASLDSEIVYKTSATTSGTGADYRNAQPLQQKYGTNKSSDDGIVYQLESCSNEARNVLSSSAGGRTVSPPATVVVLKKSPSAVVLPISPASGRCSSTSDWQSMKAKPIDLCRPRNDTDDEAGSDNGRQFTPELDGDMSYPVPMFDVTNLPSTRHLTLGFFTEPSHHVQSDSKANVGDISATTNEQKLFTGRNDQWFRSNQPMCVPAAGGVTSLASPSPPFAHLTIDNQLVSTLSECGLRASVVAPGADQFSYEKTNSDSTLSCKGYPIFIPLTAPPCPCGFPNGRGQSFCSMTSSGSHLYPVDPRRGVHYDPRILPYCSELEDLPSECLAVRYADASLAHLEESQTAVDLSLWNRTTKEKEYMAAPDVKKKVGAVIWRIIPIHLPLRRSKAVFEDPASPSASQTLFDGDFKPDMTSLVSHDIAIDRTYHRATSHSPSNTNLTSIDDELPREISSPDEDNLLKLSRDLRNQGNNASTLLKKTACYLSSVVAGIEYNNDLLSRQNIESIALITEIYADNLRLIRYVQIMINGPMQCDALSAFNIIALRLQSIIHRLLFNLKFEDTLNCLKIITDATDNKPLGGYSPRRVPTSTTLAALSSSKPSSRIESAACKPWSTCVSSAGNKRPNVVDSCIDPSYDDIVETHQRLAAHNGYHGGNSSRVSTTGCLSRTNDFDFVRDVTQFYVRYSSQLINSLATWKDAEQLLASSSPEVRALFTDLDLRMGEMKTYSTVNDVTRYVRAAVNDVGDQLDTSSKNV